SMFARVKIPGGIAQWIPLAADPVPGRALFVSLSDIVRGNLHKLYAGMTLSATTVVRLTRDAEVEIEEEPGEGLRELVEEQGRLPAARSRSFASGSARGRTPPPRTCCAPGSA